MFCTPLVPFLCCALGNGNFSHMQNPPRPHPAITAVAYSPDGKLLAVARRGEVLLHKADSGETFKKLTGQGDKVTAIAFSHDGRLLCIASGQSGLRGELRVYLIEHWEQPPRMWVAHRDLIHAVTVSPDGKLLATCSYDRLIKLWDIKSGALLRELKEHSDAVFDVKFHPRGRLLASCAADRTVKVWDITTGHRLYSLGESTDWLYSIAWSPDGKHLAAGGVDKCIRIWDVDLERGVLQQSAFAHEGPVLQIAYSTDNRSLYSIGEDRVLKAWDAMILSEKKVFLPQPEIVHSFALHPTLPQVALGRFDGHLVVVDSVGGRQLSEPLPSRFPLVPEQEPNDLPLQSQIITLPAAVTGKLGQAGDCDTFRVFLHTNEELGVQVHPLVDAKFTPLLELRDSNGTIQTSEKNVLGYRCKRPGWHLISLRDRENRGGSDRAYVLKMGPIPIVTSYFPLGLQRGTTRSFFVRGVNLPIQPRLTTKITNEHDTAITLTVTAPSDKSITRLPLPLSSPQGAIANLPQIDIGEYPDAPLLLRRFQTYPLTVDGTLSQSLGETYQFKARKSSRGCVLYLGGKFSGDGLSFRSRSKSAP